MPTPPDPSPAVQMPPGPVDETVAPQPVRELGRPTWFTLMAPGWLPPTAQITQALGICFTDDHQVVLVTWDDVRWTFPGGGVEPGETVEQALIREVAEDACATVTANTYLACQHIADPHHPDEPQSYYQSRWWARVRLDAWRPRHEMIARRLVSPQNVLVSLRRSQALGCVVKPRSDAPARGFKG